ncbi:ABC-type nitrate/sulfonate/bicarbonate transport system, ATPase component [Isobaculum melis]|uniref:ABC-type nitrate/sulfonate/bicarbonate transport system, ATPase component n=2 Tax=Isobaculum melis TaxID=142588 RepID=A0A1H9UB63_9LACT|nr:ABC-type nitrate/sulfonate/bicarbonate transport system, ATPase component [Isobaculum melis]
MKLTIKDLSLSYPQRKILEHVSFSVKTGEFVTLLGTSGSGKSTILNLLTGITQKQTGTIKVDHEEIQGLSLHFAYMPQEDLLLEWETVFDNVCLYQRIHHQPIDAAFVMKQLALFGLKGYEKAYPNELSGGMRQRVAFLRTVLCDADILLLDEPFGALDVITRGDMQDWLHEIRGKLNKTIILVTHDIDEAIYLSDRILILGGKPASIQKEFHLTEQVRSREWLYANGALRNDIYHELKGETNAD